MRRIIVFDTEHIVFSVITSEEKTPFWMTSDNNYVVNAFPLSSYEVEMISMLHPSTSEKFIDYLNGLDEDRVDWEAGEKYAVNDPAGYSVLIVWDLKRDEIYDGKQIEGWF